LAFLREIYYQNRDNKSIILYNSAMVMKTFHIQWHITDRCNLRCIDCYQEKYTRETELPFDKLMQICKNLGCAMKKWNKHLTINLTGGEPLLKNDIWELVDYLNRADYVDEIGLITNGTIIDKYIHSLKEYKKLKTIYISLDGTTPEINDDVRGNGTFRKTIENIKILIENSIPLTLMLTLMKSNLKDAGDFYSFAKSLGVAGYIIERFVPLGNGLKISDKVVNGEELNDLYRSIFRNCEVEYEPQDMVKYKAIQVKFSEKDVFAAECIVAKDGMALLPDGTVLPCRRLNIPVGNLLRDSLENIWNNSEVLNNLRNKKILKGKCGKCKFEDCTGCRAMIYSLTGDFLGEDFHCWLE